MGCNRDDLVERKPLVLASRAAIEYGKSPTAITRLCRLGKVEGQLMWVNGCGTPVWVVNRASLEAYLANFPTAKMEDVDV